MTDQATGVSHDLYLHRFAGESSLRCSCGQWKGRNLVDHEGHAEHVRHVIEADPALSTTQPKEN